jgi:hypothetical protein
LSRKPVSLAIEVKEGLPLSSVSTAVPSISAVHSWKDRLNLKRTKNKLRIIMT